MPGGNRAAACVDASHRRLASSNDPVPRPVLKTDSAKSRRVGIALVTLATVCFAVLDTCAKWLVLSLPVLEVVWLRFATHVVLMVLILAPRQGRKLFRMQSPRLHLLRAALLASMTGLNVWALQYLQLAETGAIQFSVPILDCAALGLVAARTPGCAALGGHRGRLCRRTAGHPPGLA